MEAQLLKSKSIKEKIQAFIDQSNILICPGCLEQYDQKGIIPIIICPNQHTLCNECVQNKVFCKNPITDHFQCILCRENILGPPLKKAQKEIQYINLTKKLKKIFAPYIDQFSQKHEKFEKEFNKAQNKLKKITQKHIKYDQQMIRLSQIQCNYSSLQKRQKKNKEQIEKKINKMQKSLKDTQEQEIQKIKSENKQALLTISDIKGKNEQFQKCIQMLSLRTKASQNWTFVLGIFVFIILAFCIALKIQFSAVGDQAQYLTNSSIQINGLLLRFAKQYDEQFQQIKKFSGTLISRIQKIEMIYQNLPFDNLDTQLKNTSQKLNILQDTFKIYIGDKKLPVSQFNKFKEDAAQKNQALKVKIQQVHSKVISHAMTYPRQIQTIDNSLKNQISRVTKTMQHNSDNLNKRLQQIQYQINGNVITHNLNLSTLANQTRQNFIIFEKDYSIRLKNAIFDSKIAIQNLKILNQQVNIMKDKFPIKNFMNVLREGEICLKSQYHALPFRPILVKFIPDFNFNETSHFAFYRKLSFAELNKYQNCQYSYSQRSIYYGIFSVDKMQTKGISQFSVVLQYTEQMDVFVGLISQKGKLIPQAFYTSQFAGFFYKYRMFMINGDLQVDGKLLDRPYKRQIQTLVRINRYNSTLSVLVTYNYTDFYYQTVLPQKLRNSELSPALYMKTDRDIVQFNFKRNEYFNTYYKNTLSTRMQQQRVNILTTKKFRNESNSNYSKAFSRLKNLRFYNTIPSTGQLRQKQLSDNINANQKGSLPTKPSHFRANYKLPQRKRLNHFNKNVRM